VCWEFVSIGFNLLAYTPLASLARSAGNTDLLAGTKKEALGKITSASLTAQSIFTVPQWITSFSAQNADLRILKPFILICNPIPQEAVTSFEGKSAPSIAKNAGWIGLYKTHLVVGGSWFQ
jgi:hypothetical protein